MRKIDQFIENINIKIAILLGRGNSYLAKIILIIILVIASYITNGIYYVNDKQYALKYNSQNTQIILGPKMGITFYPFNSLKIFNKTSSASINRNLEQVRYSYTISQPNKLSVDFLQNSNKVVSREINNILNSSNRNLISEQIKSIFNNNVLLNKIDIELQRATTRVTHRERRFRR